MPIGIMEGLAIGGFALNLIQGASQMGSNRSMRRIQKEEARVNIASLQDFLARYPDYAEVTEQSFEQEGRQQYRALLENYGNVGVMAGFTGQVGGEGSSAQEIQAQTREELVSFAGEDMSLAGGDGMYGKQLKLLRGNLAAQRQQAEGQLSVWKRTLRESKKNWWERTFG